MLSDSTKYNIYYIFETRHTLLIIIKKNEIIDRIQLSLLYALPHAPSILWHTDYLRLICFIPVKNEFHLNCPFKWTESQT